MWESPNRNLQRKWEVLARADSSDSSVASAVGADAKRAAVAAALVGGMTLCTFLKTKAQATQSIQPVNSRTERMCF